MNLFRVYAPVTPPGVTGSIEFGIYKDRATALDRLSRVAAELQMDHGHRVTWFNDARFMTFFNGRSMQVTVARYEMDQPIARNLFTAVHTGPVTLPAYGRGAWRN